MTSQIQQFQSDEFGVLRTFIEPDGVKFVSRDITDALGLDRTATRRLDEDEKGVRSTHTLGGDQEVSVVNEAGFYNLVLASKKPEAKAFKRWVTHDVLPSIRKHGAYMTEQTIERTLTDPDFIIRLATQLKTERAEKEKALAQVEQLEPKAQALDDFTESGPAMTIRDAAGVLRNMGLGNLRETDLRNWLLDHDWIYRKNGAYKIRSNRLDAKHLQYYYPNHKGQHRDGSMFDFNPTVYVTRRGLALLHQRISEERMPFRFNQPASQPQLPPTANYNITV